jgi:hypothetical protein
VNAILKGINRLKAEIDSLDLMLDGRSFHNSGAALEKALFPYALSLKEVLV